MLFSTLVCTDLPDIVGTCTDDRYKPDPWHETCYIPWVYGPTIGPRSDTRREVDDMYRVEMPRDDYNVTTPTLDEAMRIADGLAQDCVALVLVWSMDASMYVGRYDGRW